MSILSRYLLKLHLGPFAFALAACTSLLLLNQVARRLGDLVGKGLPWTVIFEVFALSLPFIIAMTLPMAVLVAVLYAVSRLAGDSEVTALRAGGVSLGRVLRPLVLAGAIVALCSFLFSDHVLPRSNHRLRTLYTDIARKKPTFSIKEQVINEVQRNRLFLRAAYIDPATYALQDVSIFDFADQDRRRVVYADSGYIAITEDQEDAELTLYDGTMHEFDRSDPRMFQRAAFLQDIIRVEGVGNELKRTLTDTYKGDREMGVCEMEHVVRTARREQRMAEFRADALRRKSLLSLVGLPPMQTDTTIERGMPSVYCRALLAGAAWLLPDDLREEAQDSVEEERAQPAPAQPTVIRRGQPRATMLRDSELRVFQDRARQSAVRGAHFMVEVHKKYAIAAACLIFVLVGVPIAVRFPRGGVGLVIGVSFVIFGIYYIGLIAGESLADRLVVSPAILWTPNVLFALLAIGLLYRAHTATIPREYRGLGRLRRLARGGS